MNIDLLRAAAERLVKAEPERLGRPGWWQRPLLATASIDRRFDSLPLIAFHDHLHPRDLLATARSVVIFYIPFKKKLIKENRSGDRPCRNWGVAYVQTNALIGRIQGRHDSLHLYLSNGCTKSSISVGQSTATRQKRALISA